MANENIFERLTDESSRRTFLKNGAIVGAAAAGLGAGTGSVAAQDDDAVDAEKALMFLNQFKPNAKFEVVSGVVDFTPDIEAVRDNWWSDYNTRLISYENTKERVLFFPSQDSQIEEGETYTIRDNFSLFPDSQSGSEIIDVKYEPATGGSGGN